MSKVIKLDNSKYEIVYDKNNQYPEKCLRYGQEWRDLTGDNIILYLCSMIDDKNKCIIELCKFIDMVFDNKSKLNEILCKHHPAIRSALDSIQLEEVEDK